MTDQYAADGYLAIAPARFDRVHCDLDVGYTGSDMDTARAAMQKIKLDDAVKDVAATLNEVKSAGKVGIVGYCWGGAVTWVAAARVPGLAAAVPYYGGAIPSLASEQPRCPTMLHFGEKDASIPIEKARAVASRASRRDDAFLRCRSRVQLRPARLVRRRGGVSSRGRA